jgi:apolipoprotein N-acyltransferase
LGWWPLAWIAPAGWIRLAVRTRQTPGQIFLGTYLAGFIHCMLLVHWIRLPHWLCYFGWIALSAYLAVYLPLFVGAIRVCVHHWRLPTVVAAPVVWTGLELARGHLLTGFSMSLLGHSQVSQTALIQISDTIGAYGVSFVVMTVAAALESVSRSRPNDSSPALSAAFAASILAATIGYGSWRLPQWSTPDVAGGNGSKSVRIALIQAVYDTQFDGNDARPITAFQDYLRLSAEAVRRHAPVDLVVWPESMFSANAPIVTFEDADSTDASGSPTVDPRLAWLDDLRRINDQKTKYVAANLRTNLLVGTERIHLRADRDERYNSAGFVSTSGEVTAIYDKMHPVMFGEYIPFGEVFPWLYKGMPIGGGLTAGREPKCMELDGVRLLPCICFENSVPHLLRHNVRLVRAQGQNPDCLLTITNDGWFWGSSLLDVHLACGTFRAVELRRPMLIAANTGISAWIGPSGRPIKAAGRRTEDVVIADIQPGASTTSLYERVGDLPAAACLLVTCIALVDGARRTRKPPSSSRGRFTSDLT